MENMLKVVREPAMLSGKATMSPCREVQFTFFFSPKPLSFMPFIFTPRICSLIFPSRSWLPHGVLFFSSHTSLLFSPADLCNCYTDCCICFSMMKCNLWSNGRPKIPINYVHLKNKSTPVVAYTHVVKNRVPYSPTIDKAKSWIISHSQKGPISKIKPKALNALRGSRKS